MINGNLKPMVVLQHPVAHTLCSPAAAGSLVGVAVASVVGMAAWAVRRHRGTRQIAAVTIPRRRR